MYCPNCGREVDKKDSFCQDCGIRLVQNQNNYNSNDNKYYDNHHESKSSTELSKIILIVVILALLCGIILFFSMLFGFDFISSKGSEMKTNNVQYVQTAEPTTAPTAESTPRQIRPPEPIMPNDYFYIVSSRLLTYDELSRMTPDDVALLRNLIYAKHGYCFKTEYYKKLFNSFDWYVPNPNFSEKDLSRIEIMNKDVIVEYEKELKGYE